MDVETTAPPEERDYLVIGLAIGIPCGFIIVILVLLICIMICAILRRSRQEEVEAMYMRRRFQGLSLEEQRRRQSAGRGLNKFRRRRSSATQVTPNSRRARVIRENPFGLQDWQLKLSGIDISSREEDSDTDSPPRSPLGVINPLLLQPVQDEEEVSYEPVRPERKPNKPGSKVVMQVVPTKHSTTSSQQPATGNTDSDSDSFNPYD